MRILKSLFVIVTMAVISAGATSSVFTSAASLRNDTFSTGTLQIRINSQTTAPGFTVTNAIPGTCQDAKFTIENYGAPWFSGPSTLPAKTLTIAASDAGSNASLFNALTINMTKDAGGTPELIYNGNLSSMPTSDALVSYLHTNGLAAGNSETIHYSVCLPLDAGNDLQGKIARIGYTVTGTSS